MAYKVRFEDRVSDDVAALSQGDQKAFRVCVEDLKRDPANHTVRPIEGHHCVKAHFAGDLRTIFYVSGKTVWIVMVGRSSEALYQALFDQVPPEIGGPTD